MKVRMCPHGNVRCTSPLRCSDDQCLGGDYDAIAQGLQTADQVDRDAIAIPCNKAEPQDTQPAPGASGAKHGTSV